MYENDIPHQSYLSMLQIIINIISNEYMLSVYIVAKKKSLNIEHVLSLEFSYRCHPMIGFEQSDALQSCYLSVWDCFHDWISSKWTVKMQPVSLWQSRPAYRQEIASNWQGRMSVNIPSFNECMFQTNWDYVYLYICI